jgi:hypothetical protein
MSKKLMIIGAILLCAVFFIAVELIFFKASSPDRAVLKFAKEMNKHCPLMIDFETRLDKVSALADNTLHFNYTLVYHDKDSIPVEHLKTYLEPVIMNKIKSSETLSKFLDKNLTWIYSYNDKRGKLIFNLSFTPEQFK